MDGGGGLGQGRRMNVSSLIIRKGTQRTQMTQILKVVILFMCPPFFYPFKSVSSVSSYVSAWHGKCFFVAKKVGSGKRLMC